MPLPPQKPPPAAKSQRKNAIAEHVTSCLPSVVSSEKADAGLGACPKQMNAATAERLALRLVITAARIASTRSAAVLRAKKQPMATTTSGSSTLSDQIVGSWSFAASALCVSPT